MVVAEVFFGETLLSPPQSNMDSKNDRLNMFGNIKKSISWKKTYGDFGYQIRSF